MSRLPIKPYRLEYAEQARQLALLGHSDAEIAKVVGVSLAAFTRWARDFPEFAGALAMGRDFADARVVEALFKRAIGYVHPDVDFFVNRGSRDEPCFEIVEHAYMKHYPPDTAACQFWLQNRQAEHWKSSSHTTIDGKLEVEVTGISALLSLVRENRVLEKQQLKLVG